MTTELKTQFELFQLAMATIRERPAISEEVNQLRKAQQLMKQANNILQSSPIEDPSDDSAWNDLPRAIDWLEAYLEELGCTSGTKAA